MVDTMVVEEVLGFEVLKKEENVLLKVLVGWPAETMWFGIVVK